MAGYCLAFFLLTAYLSPLYIPPNQLTVHRGSAILQPLPLVHPFGFLLKRLDLSSPRHNPRLVLFVPGHKGNVKQAISMTRFFEREGVEMEMHSVDFGEGAVAVSGDLARAEAEFVSQCLQYLAKERKGPITIITHSMGGVIVSLALALPSTPTARVSEVIALSTPFAVPPVATSLSLASVYRDMHRFWHSESAKSLLLLSFAGGIRDLTVPSPCADSGLLQAPHSLHFLTTQMQDLYLELDHLATVWGHEFFTQVAKALHVIVKNKGPSRTKELVAEQLRNRLGKALYAQAELEVLSTELREMEIVDVGSRAETVLEPGLRYRLQSFPALILSASQMPSIFALIDGDMAQMLPFTAQVEDQKLALLPSASSNTVYLEGNGQRVQQIAYIGPGVNWLAVAATGVTIARPNSNEFALKMQPGPSFASYRYPLHISILCESSQIKAVHAQCGNEEILKFNENDFTLYFNSHCPSGPSIYLLGFDSLHHYEIRLTIDWLAAMVVFARDFRMHVISTGMGWGLIEAAELPITWKASLAGLLLATVHTFSVDLRSIWQWDSMPAWTAPGVLELLYIALVGRSLHAVLMSMIAGLYRLAGLISPHTPLAVFQVWTVVAICGVYWWPWPVVAFSAILTLVYDSKAGERGRQGLQLPYLLFCTSLPELVGWLLVLIDHGVRLPLSFPEGYIVLSLLFSLLLHSVAPSQPARYLLVPAGVAILLCGFEFPYRANAVLAVILPLQALSGLWTGPKAKAA